MGGTTTTFGRPPWPLEGTRATAHVACGERRPQGRQRRAAGCARAAGLGRAVAPRGRGPGQGPICASARAGRAREVPGGHQARLHAQQWRGRRRCWPTARATRGRGARSGPGGDQHPRAGCSRALRHVLAARAQRWGPGRGVACGARRRRRRCCTRSPTWCWACPRCCSWWASAPTAGRGRYWARRTPR